MGTLGARLVDTSNRAWGYTLEKVRNEYVSDTTSKKYLTLIIPPVDVEWDYKDEKLISKFVRTETSIEPNPQPPLDDQEISQVVRRMCLSFFTSRDGKKKTDDLFKRMKVWVEKVAKEWSNVGTTLPEYEKLVKYVMDKTHTTITDAMFIACFLRCAKIDLTPGQK